MKPLKTRSKTSKARQIAFLALITVLFHVHHNWGQEGILDFDRFKAEIQPLLLNTVYALPGETPNTCFACHGDTTDAAYLVYPLSLTNARDNFTETVRQVNLDNAAISPVLVKPLSIAGGGVLHLGGQQIQDTDDSEYTTIFNWIQAAKNSSIGANISKSEPHPNPFRFFVDIVYFLTTEALEIDLIVYGYDGQEIRRYEGTTNVGANRVRWDGRTAENEPLPTGVYFYSIVGKFRDGTVVHNGRVVYTP